MYNPPQALNLSIFTLPSRGGSSISTIAEFGRIGIVARWQPVHLGHVPVLNAICRQATHALIGIGSSNRYDLRNPFTLEERLAMLRKVLGPRQNFTLIPVPDLDNGPRWRESVKGMFGPLDIFVTTNPYVWDLLKDEYTLKWPIELISKRERIPINGKLVRHAMASNQNWQEFVPDVIAHYICSNKLDTRFRQEFGLQTLALQTILK